MSFLNIVVAIMVGVLFTDQYRELLGDKTALVWMSLILSVFMDICRDYLRR